MPLDVVQLLLGHVDPRTTQLYARLSLSTARTAYDSAMTALGQQKAMVYHNGSTEPINHTTQEGKG